MSKYKYGFGSTAKLITVKPSLQAVCKRALGYEVMDATVIQGVRYQAEQDRYFDLEQSKVKWPNSKHNVLVPGSLANAVDIAPYINGKVSWEQVHCLVWAGLMLAAAEEEGVRLRWGGCWSGNPGDIGNQDLNDYVHFELVGG